MVQKSHSQPTTVWMGKPTPVTHGIFFRSSAATSTGGELGRVWIFLVGKKNVSPTIWPKGKILFDGGNPANQLIWRNYHYLEGFIRYQVVVCDFFHPTVCEIS